MKTITNELIQKFRIYLINEEKAKATIEKYIHDVTVFMAWLGGQCVEKTLVIEYKNEIKEVFKPTSVNAIISSLNSFFNYNEWYECRVKALKIQKKTYADKSKELTKQEYEKLVTAAEQKGNRKLSLLIQTICSTGIRVSELQYITVEAVKSKEALIKCKGKVRPIMLTKDLCKLLKEYIKNENIKSGSIFVTKSGKPLDRSHIWKLMKALCESAGVPKEKVFPHNLRHLFARRFYSIHKDVIRLADILGHSSVNTTRIYTMESGDMHRMQIQKLGLLLTKKSNPHNSYYVERHT